MSATETRAAPEQGTLQSWDLSQDPEATACPFRAAAKLHAGPDVFFNPTRPRANIPPGWYVTRFELQREILQNPEVFSSDNIAGFSRLLGESWPLIPLELDPPQHSKYRMLLNPLFAPARINALEGAIRADAARLIEGFRADGSCEFMAAFGRPFPVGVFLRLMGLPHEEMPQFLKWEDDLLHGRTHEQRVGAATAIKAYLLDLIAARRAHPVDDLASAVVNGRVDDKPLSDEAILGLCYLLFVGGLDTVAASLGFAFRELAKQPALQEQIARNPEIIPDAVEEMIRAHGVVTTFRYLTRDHDFHGAAMKKGDRVTLPLGLASRDDAEYPDPHAIDFSRSNTRSITFSAGPHRCVGSHLARREFKIALEEWNTRIGPFSLTPGSSPKSYAVGVWGMESLDLSWKARS